MTKTQDLIELLDVRFLIALLAFFSGVWLLLLVRFNVVLWDEAVYIGMGKFLFSGGHVGLWEIFRPVALPIMLGPGYALGKTIIWAKLIAFMFAIAYTALACVFAKSVTQRSAPLAGILILLTPVFFFQSFQVMTEIPAGTFIILSLLFAHNNRFMLAGAAAGVAFLFKFPAGLVIAAIIAWLLLRKDTHSSIKVVAAFTMVIAPYLVASHLAYGSLFEMFRMASIAQSNPVHVVSSALANLFYYPWKLVQNPLLLFAIPGIISIKKKAHNLAFITLLLFIIYFTVIPNKQLRFALLFLPLIAAFAAQGLSAASCWLAARFHAAAPFAIVLVIAASLAVVIPQQESHYEWYAISSPELQSFYQRFISDERTILTTDPTPAAYTNAKFIPYYYSVFSAAEIYKQNIGQADTVIYTPEPFPCAVDDVIGSARCLQQKEYLLRLVQQDNFLLVNATIDGQHYIILRNPQLT
jgi:hypothetical protein